MVRQNLAREGGRGWSAVCRVRVWMCYVEMHVDLGADVNLDDVLEPAVLVMVLVQGGQWWWF